MRLTSIAVRGYTTFRNELQLDLRALPDGLIVFNGLNGAGKTSLLEAAPGAIWRDLPSRPGEMVDFMTGRDSYLQVEYEIAGEGVYRARVNVDVLGRKSEAAMTFTAPDGTTRILTDGKVSSFDQWVREHLPPLEVFLSSAFAAQFRRRGFAHADRKGRKEIICEVLGFGRYARMAETARASAAIVEAGRDRLRAVAAQLARDTSDEVRQALDRRTREAQDELAAALERLGCLDARLALLEGEHASAVDASRAYAVAVQRQREVQSALQTLEQEIDAIESKRTAAIDQQRHELDQIAKDRARAKADLDEQLAAIDAAAAAEKADRENRIANNQRLLEGAERIRQAIAEKQQLEQEIEHITATAAAARAELRRIEAAREDLRRQVVTLETADAELRRARQSAALLGTVPCGGAGDYAGCQLLTEARAAAARIPDLEAQVQSLPALRASVAELDATIDREHAAERTVAESLRQRQLALSAARDRAKKAEPLANAEGQIAVHREALRQIPDRVAEQRAAVQTATDRRLAELDTRTREADERAFATIDRCQQRAQELATQLSERQRAVQEADAAVLPLAAAASRLEHVQADQRAAKNERAVITATIARIEERLAGIDVERARVAARRLELDAVSASIASLDTQLLEWQTLTRALSRDGLPTLEIEHAGPTISSLTNQLLEVCAGGRYTVDFITQEARADGKGLKEVFELRVLDNREGGDARDVARMSGGQQALIIECLMSAIACFVNTMSPMPIRTLWRDETSSALDAENRANFVPMLRRVMEIGGFQQVLLITHDEDIKAQANAQIWVHDGTAEILMPPFIARQEAA